MRIDKITASILQKEKEIAVQQAMDIIAQSQSGARKGALVRWTWICEVCGMVHLGTAPKNCECCGSSEITARQDLRSELGNYW
ncbi:hypothetical protein EPA93_30810 [Ktedonosporobacter rubrisoli]|uniref:Rubrerythrin family protein n=1 Tax=Ktedonosporobacter rubrisoli TaxID=2509675 RepID=A0A4P6JWZ1_KTERU|nr:hypothetical protein [Ktedonosporobacter rubrisoli]QBD80134.1 hypothetical protein EPA93_30810 [Ktedonosporobacter rubrisoli]